MAAGHRPAISMRADRIVTGVEESHRTEIGWPGGAVMEHAVKFGDYVLDPRSQQLWSGMEPVRLTSKAYGVLVYLAEHPGALVTKDELFDAVWPDTVVSDATLTSCIREIRKALGDDARTPRYLETAHRRGYRLIAPVEATGTEGAGRASDRGPASGQAPDAPRPRAAPVPLVGREAELGRVHAWMDEARRGERRIVFVRGEPGIGKTALVERFLDELAVHDGKEPVEIGQGQCVETFGTGESYFPVLEALRRLCRGAYARRLVPLLREHAPTWLAQLPGLLPSDEWEQLLQEVRGVTRERMLRELAEALEVLAAERPLVLVLEDLHWSDGSTIALLGSLARRREPARLLVVATYRPVETAVAGHPLHDLVQELSSHQQYRELAVAPLRARAIGELIALRLGGAELAARLPAVLHARSGGNPLFLVSLVEALIENAVLERADGTWTLNADVEELPSLMPESLRRLMARQKERLLPAEQRVLDAAAVAGTEFCVATVAAALDQEVVAVEAVCAGLVKRHAFLEPAGFAEWPDGTRATRFGFQHAFHQEFCFDDVGLSQRMQWQLRMGERLERAYGARTPEVACELAMRFEQGGAPARAVRYLRQAGENALEHNGYGEAIGHLRRGVRILDASPGVPDRERLELRLQLLLGHALLIAEDHRSRQGEASYQRARTLCRRTGDTGRLLVALVGLFWFHILRAEHRVAGGLTDQIREVSEQSNDAQSRMWANISSGTVACMRGDFPEARAQIEQGLAVSTEERSLVPTGMGAHSLRLFGSETVSTGMAALTVWHLGLVDRAARTMEAGLARAEERGHPYGLAMAHAQASHVYLALREAERCRRHAETSAQLCGQHGFRDVATLFPGDFYLGWALAQEGRSDQGIAQMEEGLREQQASGVRMFLVERLAFLAQVHLASGRIEDASQALTDASAMLEATGECPFEGEIHRLRGEILLAQGGVADDGEQLLRRALDIADARQARTLELRAAMSLARALHRRDGDREGARAILSPVYARFSEGFTRQDLREAKALLRELDA